MKAVGANEFGRRYVGWNNVLTKLVAVPKG